MGICVYCNEPAGFLRKKHKECVEKHDGGKSRIEEIIVNRGLKGDDPSVLEKEINAIAVECFIPDHLKRDLIISGWKLAVYAALDDGVLTKEEEDKLSDLCDHFRIEDDLQSNGSMIMLIKGSVIRDLSEGIIKTRLSFNSALPFNFQKGEQCIWLFQGVDYYETRVKSTFQGGSRGVSVRICKGVYGRVGAFKGESIKTDVTELKARGLLCVTNKHIYFHSSSKSFRIAFSKIVSFDPYSDGIGVQRDALTAKPQIFSTGDGWFTGNLMAMISNLDSN